MRVPKEIRSNVRMDTNVVLLDDEDLQALDEAGPHPLAFRRRLEALLQHGVPVTKQPTSAADPRVFTVVRQPDNRHGGLVIGEDALDFVLVDVVERLVERVADLELGLAEGPLEEHLVEPCEEVDAPPAHGVGGVVASDGDLVNVLLGLGFCISI